MVNRLGQSWRKIKFKKLSYFQPGTFQPFRRLSDGKRCRQFPMRSRLWPEIKIPWWYLNFSKLKLKIRQSIYNIFSRRSCWFSKSGKSLKLYLPSPAPDIVDWCESWATARSLPPSAGWDASATSPPSSAHDWRGSRRQDGRPPPASWPRRSRGRQRCRPNDSRP